LAITKKLLIFDLDGVIYTGDEPVEYAAESLTELRKREFGIRFLTNNSTRSRLFYAEKLESMGMEAAPEEVMSSALATRCYLKERSPHGAKVFVVGEEGIAEELEGFEIVSPENKEDADYVVVGMDRHITFDKLADAFDALRAGAEMIATNRDPTYPMPGGKLLPGGGAIVAALAEAWGRTPYVAGKPNPLGLNILMRSAGVSPGETLMIGDRPSSDMVTGRNAGVQTCLVLTGVTSREDVATLSGDYKPDFVIDDLRGLLDPDFIISPSIGGSENSDDGNKKS